MKGLFLAFATALLAAGCGPQAEPVAGPIRVDPASLRPTPKLTGDAARVASARAYRTSHCATEGERTWTELPAGRRRKGLELAAAAARGDEASVEALLAEGADPSYAEPGDPGPLAAAAKCDRAVIVRRLLKAGARLDGRYEWSVSNLVYRQTALMIAAQHGSEDAVRALLAAGADPNLEQLGRFVNTGRFEPWGRTLMLAETNAVALLLLEAGADPNAGDVTPFMSAAEARDVDRVRLLLAHGGDLKRRDGKGRNALDHARQSPARTTEVVQLLEAATASATP